MPDEKKYYYSEIFHSIQGEGHYPGTPTKKGKKIGDYGTQKLHSDQHSHGDSTPGKQAVIDVWRVEASSCE